MKSMSKTVGGKRINIQSLSHMKILQFSVSVSLGIYLDPRFLCGLDNKQLSNPSRGVTYEN